MDKGDIARLKEPKEGELERYFEDNVRLYRQPALVTVSQVFLDPDKREGKTLDDAAQLLDKLRAGGEPEPGSLKAGDRLMLQSYYPAKSEFEIRRQFGSDFSRAVMQLAPGQWHGPVSSGFGTHLIFVHALEVAPPPVFADVRSLVLANWQEEQRERFNAQFFESLKSRYEIVIEEIPDLPGGRGKADTRANGASAREVRPES